MTCDSMPSLLAPGVSRGPRGNPGVPRGTLGYPQGNPWAHWGTPWVPWGTIGLPPGTQGPGIPPLGPCNAGQHHHPGSEVATGHVGKFQGGRCQRQGILVRGLGMCFSTRLQPRGNKRSEELLYTERSSDGRDPADVFKYFIVFFY